MKPYKKNRTYQYLFSAAHMCSDINQGSLSSILPFLIAAYNFNYQTAATLVFLSNLVGSLVQPLFGQLADKKNIPWSMGIAVLLAGGGMASLGFLHSYGAMCVAVIISGIGSAMFHPQAARLVNLVSEKKKTGTSISIFSFGGNLGFTVGPMIVTAAITAIGLHGIGFLCIPSIIVSGVLFGQSRNLTNSALEKRKTAEGTAVIETETLSEKKFIPDQWGSFIFLAFFMCGRSIMLTGLNTFLSLFFIDVLGQTEVFGNSMVSMYYFISTITTLFGGAVADRYGYRKMIKIAFVAMSVFMFAFSFSRTVWISVLLLIPIAVGANLTYSPLVVLGQKYLPNHLGLASGLTLGLANSLGGIVSPLLGRLADGLGLEYAIFAIAGVTIIPVVFSFLLPEPKEA